MKTGFFSWFGNRAEIQRLRDDNDYLSAKLAEQRELLRLTVEGSRDVEKQMAVAEKDRQEAITSAVHWRTLAAALRTVNADLDAKLSRLQAGQEPQAEPAEHVRTGEGITSPWQPADAGVVGGVDFGSSWSLARRSGGGQCGIDRRNNTQEQRNAD